MVRVRDRDRDRVRNGVRVRDRDRDRVRNGVGNRVRVGFTLTMQPFAIRESWFDRNSEPKKTTA